MQKTLTLILFAIAALGQQPEAEKFYETRQLLFARGITYQMFAMSDIEEFPCVHVSVL